MAQPSGPAARSGVQLAPASIYIDRRSMFAREILQDSGLHFAAKPRDADLIWVRKGFTALKDKLAPHQLLNHIPRQRALINKGLLTENLQRYDAAQTKYDFALRSFYPETYRLYAAQDRRRFFEELSPEARNDVWILKPVGQSKGRGIEVVPHADELARFRRLQVDREQPTPEDSIVQRYIKNPLLLKERKSEIRVYWLIASIDPLLVLLRREGTVRMTSAPYQLGDFSNQLIHVTNTYQQKRHPDFDPSSVLKWTFAELQKYLADELACAPPDFIEATLLPRFRRILAFAVDSAREALAQRPANGLFFALLGADFILDDQLAPWLTEVQKGPGLSYDDPVKKDLIPPLLKDVVSMVLEVQRRTRRGESLAGLECPADFDWVIKEI